jgi:hypothetical protein
VTVRIPEIHKRENNYDFQHKVFEAQARIGFIVIEDLHFRYAYRFPSSLKTKYENIK